MKNQFTSVFVCSICILLIALSFIACRVSKNTVTNKAEFADNVVVAHRGAWKKSNHPENAIASLKQTIALKCSGSEFDVRMTADDSLIINHDPDYHFSVFKIHPEWIESTKQSNIALNAWTVNEATDMDWFLANGFDFITTNETELLFERIKMSPTTMGWKLIWSDEFNYTGLPDSTKWSYEEGGHGWGNNELQYYTKEDTLNAQVANGMLHIIARKGTKANKEYTSARLTTKSKADFTYGKIEVRARLPKGRGLWPAIWMLGNNRIAGWPECGEIDIMEHVGFDADSVFGTIHTKAYNHTLGTQKGKKAFIEKPYDQFHLYGIEWTPEKIDFLLDGKLYNRIVNEHKTKAEWPFDDPFYLIINIAVGGNLGGKHGVDDTIFPSTMEVDFIRVFKN